VNLCRRVESEKLMASKPEVRRSSGKKARLCWRVAWAAVACLVQRRYTRGFTAAGATSLPSRL
jgi:hypothetical protein